MKRGLFITLEGIEGSGKSTVVSFLIDRLKHDGIDYVLTREPGGTEIAERIRSVVLAHYQEDMHPDTEMLLYFAGRAQHLNQLIIPALDGGRWVICDRFTDATYAYQGGGRGLPREKIAILEQWVQEEIRPDYTFLLDLPAEIGLSRIRANRCLDRIEEEDRSFFEKVRDYYLAMVQWEPNRFIVIDAARSLDDVSAQIDSELCKIIEEWKEVEWQEDV
jgi:dTMP kinase